MEPQHTIDISDLTPDDVRAVESFVETLRTAPKSVGPEGLSLEEWTKRFREWVDSHPKREIEFDDSRGSIYEGRGE